MAFLSHFKPKRIRMIPTARRKSLIGTHLTSATPSVATITASVAAAANAPSSELRQLIVTPTTSTMVNASTNSTAEARNAAVAIAHCMQLFSYSGVWRYLVSGPGTVLSRQCIAISYLIVTHGRVCLLIRSVVVDAVAGRCHYSKFLK